ncbi:hypothetical protein Tco_0032836 [Tanacetum coccineum]
MVSATKDHLTFNDLMATPSDFSKYVLNRLKIENLTHDPLLGPAYNLLKGTCTSNIELEYNFQEYFNELKDKLDWNNPEGDHYPFDLSKPLPLQGRSGDLTVAANYFFNNDLEFLKLTVRRNHTLCLSRRPKPLDMIFWVLKTWSSRFGILSNMHMTKTLQRGSSIGAKGKLHGYGHLEEVVVKRDDQELYKFKECDFVDIHLNDIEDMLLLAIQHKLFYLNESDIVDFIIDLRMFTRSLIMKRRVEDLQLGDTQESSGLASSQNTRFSFGIQRRDVKEKVEDHRQKRSEIKVELINKQMRERQIIRNLKPLNQRDLPRDIPLDRIEVLRYDTKGVKVRKGKMQTKTELTLEQTQQGVSDEVLVSIEGVEELKRNVKIKGEKKESLLTLRQKLASAAAKPSACTSEIAEDFNTCTRAFIMYLSLSIEHDVVQFRRTSLTGFPAQSIRSSNVIALDSPYLLVLITGTSQSRQHGKSESDSYNLSD